jgi:hypothetical protein
VVRGRICHPRVAGRYASEQDQSTRIRQRPAPLKDDKRGQVIGRAPRDRQARSAAGLPAPPRDARRKRRQATVFKCTITAGGRDGHPVVARWTISRLTRKRATQSPGAPRRELDLTIEAMLDPSEARRPASQAPDAHRTRLAAETAPGGHLINLVEIHHARCTSPACLRRAAALTLIGCAANPSWNALSR